MADSEATVCSFEHRGFALFDAPLFRRRDGDDTPVVVVRLGEREAAMPLRSLQREFGIADDSADGRMFGLIAEALDFVPALRLGDPIPEEVLSGAASWDPEPEHLIRALNRLRLRLLSWLRGEDLDETKTDTADFGEIEDDPILKAQVQEAFQRAADALGLASKDAAIEQLEALAQEFAYIEALRDRLLSRVRTTARRIGVLATANRRETGQIPLLDRLRFLIGEAHGQIARRFDEQDAQTGEIVAVLRNFDRHRTYIRTTRDWLYRCWLAWDPLLREWDRFDAVEREEQRAILGRTYQFLAPRFMPVTEWLKADKGRKKADNGNRMVW